MQLGLDFGARQDFREIYARLLMHFGPAPEFFQLDPVDQLVNAIISSRTLDEVSARAFERLIRRYDTWLELIPEPPARVRPLIAEVQDPDKKAIWVGGALRQARARGGALDLEVLRPWPVPDSLSWLERLPGVGRKVASAVLNFSTLHKPALVIDRHVLRILKRLRLIGLRSDTAKAFDAVTPALSAWSASELSDLHYLLKRLGQRICHAEAPDCGRCPLRTLCHRTKAA
jgi:endonuclease-3